VAPINPGPPVVGATGAGVHWMVPDTLRNGPFDNPLYDQGNIQVDNPTAHSITAWAIGVPAGSVDSPILGLAQAEYGGGLPNGWQSATVTRHQWDNNVWTAPNVNDPSGGPAGEWEPAPGPGDWSPLTTNDDGVRFDDLFGKGQFDTAILFWTVDLDHAIAPGTTMNGFLLGSIGHGLSGRSLPFADFGVDGLLGTGNLKLVPEPTALGMMGLAALGMMVRRRRRGN
jgi:hypothetical protein